MSTGWMIMRLDGAVFLELRRTFLGFLESSGNNLTKFNATQPQPLSFMEFFLQISALRNYCDKGW
jgi:hypothetical protein